MKTIFRVLFAFVLTTGVAFGGTAPSHLSCKSTNKGKPTVVLKGVIPVRGDDINLTLSLGASKLLIEEWESMPHVIEALDNRVFSFVIRRKDERNLVFYALPRTVKAKKGSRSIHARFEAMLVKAPKPGYVGPVSDKAMIRNIRMSCIYDRRL